MKVHNFFFDIRLNVYWQNAFVKILLKTYLLGKDLQNRGNVTSVVDFGCNNNAIKNQKHFKPIANGNVADSGTISLTDEPILFWKPKKEWKFKCKSWIKKLINCCFSRNITKHKLAAYLMYLCYFFSFLY